MAKSYMQKVTPEAKRLYKTGRYKTYADAFKAAGKQHKVGAIKVIQKGETKKTPAKRVYKQLRKPSGKFKGLQRVSGVSQQIGAIKKGSTFKYYKGIQIERMPVVTLKGKRKITKYVYVVHSKVHHSLSSAEAFVRAHKKGN